jgi:hypothetical protein
MPTQTFAIFTPQIWSPRINFFLKNKLAAARAFSDYSEEVVEGGDRINIPNISDGFSSTAITTTTGAITGANISDTKSVLSVSSWQGNKLILTDFQVAQVKKSYRLKEEYMMAQSYALAKAFDSVLIRLGHNSAVTTVGNSATALLSTTIEKAMAILSSRGVVLNECSFLMHPQTYYRRILGVQKYYDASQFGKPSLPQGVIDYLYGVPVIVTQQITTATTASLSGQRAGTGWTNLLAHKSAIAYAFGNIPGMGFEGGIRLSERPSSGSTGANLAVEVIADHAYGTLLLNSSRMIRILDKV